ncbi:hypothetical protein MY3296_001891 [Beauveria thailandica]
MPPLKANSLRLAPQYEQLLPRSCHGRICQSCAPYYLRVSCFLREARQLVDRPAVPELLVWGFHSQNRATEGSPQRRHRELQAAREPPATPLPARRCRCVMGPSPEFIGPAWASQALDDAFRLTAASRRI